MIPWQLLVAVSPILIGQAAFWWDLRVRIERVETAANERETARVRELAEMRERIGRLEGRISYN